MFRVLLSTALLIVPLAPIFGQETPRFEITPFGGYRFNGNFEVENPPNSYEINDDGSFGLLFNIRHQANTQWEILYSRQDTTAVPNNSTGLDPAVDIDLQVLQLGGTYQGRGETVRPYLSLTLGGTHISTSSGGEEDDTFFSGSLGIGLNMLQSSRVGVRVEARWYSTLLNSDSDLFCRTGPDENICAFQIEGTTLDQFETFAGVIFRF